ncbi:MAG: DNA polymerase III subunit delta [Ignavibacteriae bacterium]|nr:DNA polymerase III subunit delta [Ignavibacteriota bacterium]
MQVSQTALIIFSMAMAADNFEQLLASNDFPPIIFLFGEEEFLLEEAYTKLINRLCPDENSRYDLEILDFEESKSSAAVENLIRSCNSLPFISPRRVVVVKRFENAFSGRLSAKSEEYERLSKYLNNPQKTTCLIIRSQDEKLKGFSSAKSGKGKDKLDKLIKDAKFPYNILLDKHTWFEFPKVYESELSSWVNRRFKEIGKKIEPNAVEMLISQSNPNLRDINNEIEKILLYIDEKEEITLDDVTFIVGSSRVYNIFELQKAIGKRKMGESLMIVENMLANERQEMLIMTMLTRYFIALWKLIEESGKTNNNYQLAGKVGINPYFVSEYLHALTFYSPNEIENAFLLLCETDEKLKSTSTDSLYLIQNMLVRIMKK